MPPPTTMTTRKAAQDLLAVVCDPTVTQTLLHMELLMEDAPCAIRPKIQELQDLVLRMSAADKDAGVQARLLASQEKLKRS